MTPRCLGFCRTFCRVLSSEAMSPTFLLVLSSSVNFLVTSVIILALAWNWAVICLLLCPSCSLNCFCKPDCNLTTLSDSWVKSCLINSALLSAGLALFFNTNNKSAKHKTPKIITATITSILYQLPNKVVGQLNGDADHYYAN